MHDVKKARILESFRPSMKSQLWCVHWATQDNSLTLPILSDLIVKIEVMVIVPNPKGYCNY